MESILSTLAFALLIGGQFLAVIVLNSNREAIYSEPEAAKRAQHPSSEQIPGAVREQKLPAASCVVESPQHRPRPSLKGPRMELAQIRYFVALCGERSLRRSGRSSPSKNVSVPSFLA
jgi:hypothetical protein